MKKSVGARTILYPAPVLVVGTFDGQGRPNVMTAAWGGICCSKPPCVAVSIRKARYTYQNLLERRAFSISLPSERYAAETDYFGIVSGRKVDKFAVTGLTPATCALVDAPYVAEFPLVLECGLKENSDLGAHTLFVGEILDVRVDEELLSEEGQPLVEELLPMSFAPEHGGYFGLGAGLGRAFEIGRRFALDETGG